MQDAVRVEVRSTFEICRGHCLQRVHHPIKEQGMLCWQSILCCPLLNSHVEECPLIVTNKPQSSSRVLVTYITTFERRTCWVAAVDTYCPEVKSTAFRHVKGTLNVNLLF